MTVNDLLKKIAGLPLDAEVDVCDTANERVEISTVYIDRGPKRCSLGHEHEHVSASIMVDGRFR